VTVLKKKTDAELISAYSGGRDKAFEILFSRYKNALFSFILRFIGDRDDAEDLFQQTWLKVLNGLRCYRERGTFAGWLFGIANNCCVDLVRKRSKIPDSIVSPDELPARGTPLTSLEAKEKRQWLKNAVHQLPVEQRQVVLLRVYGELQFNEIAQIVEAPLNTVLGRMHYAVQNLQRRVHAEKKEVSGNVLS
jgi:RNA polymerase sigma-70 factor (ECF subfamily)